MLMLPVSSATFDERFIQRSGSGETDNSSGNSGLATPQDESGQPLGSMIDLKHASEAIASKIDRRHSSLQSRIERQPSTHAVPILGYSDKLESKPVGEVPPDTMVKMIPSESGSSISQSPEFEEPEVTHMKAKHVYNLPNRHISIDIQEQDNLATSDTDDLVNGFVEPTMGLISLLDRKWNKKQVGEGVLRVIFFLPWCIAVGGSIVFWPSKLDKITFHTGYLEPLVGIYRFAHWADRAFEHIVIFLAFLGFLAWYNPTLGITLGCLVGALAVNAWYDFRLDPTVPLGQDDRQSIYLSITKFWLTDEFLNLRREKNGCYVLDQESRGEKMIDVDDSEAE